MYPTKLSRQEFYTAYGDVEVVFSGYIANRSGLCPSYTANHQKGFDCITVVLPPVDTPDSCEILNGSTYLISALEGIKGFIVDEGGVVGYFDDRS